MKKVLFLTFVSLFSVLAYAQEIIARHNDKGMYVVHTVTAKETFYSLGRLFNVPPKDIAAYNNLTMEGGLSIGQTINIPLTATNFSQAKTTAYPVYYVVGEKEGLYRVSVNNNKVLMASLRKWNNLQSDVISAGQKLVVGYLVTPDPNMANVSRAATTTTTNTIPEKKDPPAVAADNNEVVAKKEEEKPVVKTPPPAEKKADQPKFTSGPVNDGNGGYFKPSFDAQVKSQPLSKDEVATAGIFKTASGWQDAKYYALIDNVEPGTIIRIVNPNNNKAIYAKVLDKMTGVRQNQGYNVRISNAAATALDITETEKFFIRVNY